MSINSNPKIGKNQKNFWKNKEVLITGAGGFIASHLVEALIVHGARVRAFVRYNSRNDPGLLSLVPPETIQKTEIIAGDLRDLAAVQSAIRGVHLVFHLGALITIPYSYLHPSEVVETNVIGTLNVLLACRDEGVQRLVHTSTSEVYGTALRVPIDEEHPLQGQSPYSASKIGADKLAESFFNSFDIPIVILRPFNTYGPRQSARAVIPTIITQALTQSTVSLGNLDAKRDLTYITDTVSGFMKSAEISGIEGETFNLGTGQEIRIGDLAQEVISLVDKPVEIIVDSNRLRPEKSEVQRLLADNTKAKKVLGWEPRVTLTEGLGKTIEWINQNMDRYQIGVYEI
jgi:dTDP-glucose 4,6-dehydratase